MAKGKYAAKSALRVQRTVDEHIDRLTSQLVEAKARAREFERDAQLVPDLRKKIDDLERRIRDDVVLLEVSNALKEANEAYDRVASTFSTVYEAFMDILRRYNRAVLHMPGANIVEWLVSKWPDLVTDPDHRFEAHATSSAKKLSDEALFRLQALHGDRWMDHDGMPIVGIDRMDGAAFIGISREDLEGLGEPG